MVFSAKVRNAVFSWPADYYLTTYLKKTNRLGTSLNDDKKYVRV